MQKVFSILLNNHPDYLQCVESRPIPEWIEHELITERFVTKGDRPFTEDVDVERLYHMQKNPNAWYLDADVKVIKWPDFELTQGFVYISYHSNQQWYDNWCILGNGCQDFFDDLMDRHAAFNGPAPAWWSHVLFNGELKSKIKPVPDGYFDHQFFGRDKKVPVLK